ncbi:protein unc-93 homolog A isoform X2 [Engystomops pustulosus]|uniref:protein unc-93 homolog A isoform X2 n=1 Tax=Engystomops pustulosus TaxID=76066 RepID=UPI003AFA0218
MDRHLKNILVVSFGFLLLFTAFGGLQSLQSSLNADEGLGVASLSIIYGALIISSMFVPPIVIKKIGCKWTIVGSMCCYITYSLGNFYPSWYTLIPTSVILGFGGAPLWAAKCTYLTLSGNRYAEKAGKVGKDIVNQYFGLFFLIFQSSGVWGNLISSLIFGQTPDAVYNSSLSNYTHCGANDCPYIEVNTANSTNSKQPTKSLIYTLLGIYTGSGVLAVLLISIFLDNISLKSENKEKDIEDIKDEPIWLKILETLRHLKDIRQCLLIPITMWSGFEQGFLAGDYTKSYVTCSLGIHYVGYVMICFAATNALCSLLFGKLSQYTGRIFLFCFALYGLLFDDHKEAAFANYRLWESLGFVIAYGYSTFLCVSVKLYILLAVLVLGMVLYAYVEHREKKKESSKMVERDSDDSLDNQMVK